MTYATKDLTKTLKQARKRKGLSQRALSEISGVGQYQISKFENGTIDLRLSSLIELARALDMELTLVPRKSVSAVKSIVRSNEPKGVARSVIKELNRTFDTVKNLRAVYPDLGELKKLQNSIQTFKNLQGIGEELDRLREITRPVRELEKLAETSRKVSEAVTLSAKQLETLQQAASTAQSLRNRLVHSIPESSSLPRPAYSLGEGDDG